MKGQRGAWINQYSQPSAAVFRERARQVDYVIVKYGLRFYEELARAVGVPWLAEIYAYETAPEEYGRRLAEQANQPGCIGAVLNLEYSDGSHWDQDDGSRTNRLLDTFFRIAPGKPIFASIDTRGGRPSDPYQRILADRCTGVMPMVYPGAFQQTPEKAFASCISPRLKERWGKKPVIPTYQTYGDISSADVSMESTIATALYERGEIAGANFYTLGHATQNQWNRALEFQPRPKSPLPDVDLQAALIALRKAWVEQWTQIANRGTAQEAAALADYWLKLVS